MSRRGARVLCILCLVYFSDCVYAATPQEVDKATQELSDRLFPGGPKELEFKARTIMQLCNGKLDVGEAARL